MRSFALALLLAASVNAATLLVLNKEGSLAIVDPATHKVLGKVPTGEGPHEVVASPDGKWAVVSNYGNQVPGTTLSVIDVPSRKEIHRVELGLIRPHGLHYAEGRAYFSAEGNKLIGRYDPNANRVDWLMGTGQEGSHMVLLSPDNSRIFVPNIASSNLSIFERMGGGWRHTLVPTGQGPEGLDVLPDGSQVWTANSRDGSVTIIDVAGRKVAATFDVGTSRSNRLKFTPDGKRALISDLNKGELVFVDVATRSVTKRIPVGRGLAGILVTPDGKRAYAAATGDNFVGIIDLDKMEMTGRVESGMGPDGLAWIVN